MDKTQPKRFILSFIPMAWRRICDNKTLTGTILILTVGVFITAYFAISLFSKETWGEDVVFPIVLIVTEVALIGVIWHLISQTNFFRNQLADVLYGEDLKRETLEYIEYRWKQVTSHMVDVNFKYLKDKDSRTYKKVQKEIIDKYFGAIDYYIYKEERKISIDSIKLNTETGKRIVKCREVTKLYLIPATPNPKFLYGKHMRCLGNEDKITPITFTINGNEVEPREDDKSIIFEKELSSAEEKYEVKWETFDEMVCETYDGAWIFLTRREFAIDSTIIIEHGANIMVKLETMVPYKKETPNDRNIDGITIYTDSWHNDGVDFPVSTMAVLIQEEKGV